MTIIELIRLAERRIGHLEQRREVASAEGDAEALATYEAEIAQTQATLTQLRSLT